MLYEFLKNNYKEAEPIFFSDIVIKGITKSAVNQQLKKLCNEGKLQKYDIEKVILFGSRARGDFRRTSDIDIAVTGGDFARFALDVDEETSTLLEYDIVNLDRDMQDELRESIEKEGRILYEKI